MERVSRLVAHHYGRLGGELSVGGIPISQIVADHGTPLYVYSAAVLDRAWSLLRQTFPARFTISYSVKANPNPAILGWFVAKGCGLEVASAGELALARAAECPPDEIVFAGPGKTEAELEEALAKGIGEIHAESRLEVRRIAAIARHLGLRAPVALRVNPAAEVQGGAIRMGGKPTAFGIDEEALDETVDAVEREADLDLRGLHLFTGTQILDHDVLLRQYAKGVELARRVASRRQCPLATLDFGGGLGVPYFPGERPLDTSALHEGLVALAAKIERDPLVAPTRLLIEPGRFLVAEAGIYVTRINDVKVSRGKTFVILDGGMNHHLAASGNLGQVIRRPFPMAVVNKLDREAREVVEVVGPLCTPLDTLGRDVKLPNPEVGDLLGVFQSGAYGLTASPVNFLSHPTPAEVLIEGGAVRLIRARGAAAW
jgi:diaminopimelate decarboxylase